MQWKRHMWFRSSCMPQGSMRSFDRSTPGPWPAALYIATLTTTIYHHHHHHPHPPGSRLTLINRAYHTCNLHTYMDELKATGDMDDERCVGDDNRIDFKYACPKTSPPLDRRRISTAGTPTWLGLFSEVWYRYIITAYACSFVARSSPVAIAIAKLS